jgi:hypothetical protein
LDELDENCSGKMKIMTKIVAFYEFFFEEQTFWRVENCKWKWKIISRYCFDKISIL